MRWQPLVLHNRRYTVLFNPDNAQLTNIIVAGQEFMYGRGRPEEHRRPEDNGDLGYSETQMWPFVGPAKDGKILIDGREYQIGQHGLLRHLDWNLASHLENELTFRTVYHAGQMVTNKKMKSPDEPKEYGLPIDFQADKRFLLAEDYLEAHFRITNLSTQDILHSWGWHPTFMLGENGPDGELFETSDPEGGHYIADVKAASGSELAFKGGEKVKGELDTILVYQDNGRYVMVGTNCPYINTWSKPDAKYISIEPITKQPDKNFTGFTKGMEDVLVLKPGESIEFLVTIEAGLKEKMAFPR